MTHYDINVRQGLPAEMQTLLRDYPRDDWPEHPNFAASTRNWMGAHQSFRQLADILREDTEAVLDRTLPPEAYAASLARYGNLLVRSLHGHHTWEDRSFFPELEEADPRFARGLGMLENDHHEMDGILDRLTRGANRYLKLMDLSPQDAGGELAALDRETGVLGKFLARHLADEEDLAVPIILHYRLRG
ncbi:hemerythrin domain-containing protein [Roseobacteraceae bacterium NS-SX3]